MSNEEKDKLLDQLLSLSREDIDKIVSNLTLHEIELLLQKMSEVK